MTLLERAKALHLRANRQRKYEEREHVAQTLRDRTANIQKLIFRLEAARTRLAAIRKSRLRLTDWPAPPVAAFQAYYNQGSPSQSTDAGRVAWEQFVLAFGNFIESAEKLVRQDLDRIKKSVLGGVSAQDLATYEADPSTRTVAQHLIARFNDLTRTKWDSCPADTLLDLLARATAVQTDIGRLHESGSSTEVRAFLVAARTPDGAPFEMLTEEVRTELEERSQLSRLRVILR